MGKASKRKRIRRNENYIEDRQLEGSLIVEVYDEKGKGDADRFYGRKFDWLEVSCGYQAIKWDARSIPPCPTPEKHE